MKLYTAQDYNNPRHEHIASEAQDIAVEESEIQGLNGKEEIDAGKNTARGSVVL